MAAVKRLFHNFLENSTIHGLQYIAVEKKKIAKMIWIFIVFCGFSTAAMLIIDSVKSWEESPVSTSVETLPISKVKFPEVTVCPPLGSNTALNHDIMTIREAGLSKEERFNALIVLWDSMDMVENNRGWSIEDIRDMYQDCLPFSYQIQACNHRGGGEVDGNLMNCTYEKKQCDSTNSEDVDIDCRTSDLGAEYTGTQNKTSSGYTCQNWSSQSPQEHSYSNVGDHNYCRNPSDYSGGLWCYTTDQDKRWETCDVPVCGIITQEPGAECERVSTLGVDYRGTVFVTKSGKTCQAWSSQSPNEHSYGHLSAAENYCRGNGAVYKDPNGMANNLWCYTTDPNTRWENCKVPDCSHDVGQGEMFQLWMNLFYHLTVEKQVDMNEIMQAVAKAKSNSTSKGKLICSNLGL